MTADAAALEAVGFGDLAAAAAAAGDLELPRPLRLLLTAGWNLTESVGLPVAAYAVGAWLFGRDPGLVAGLAAIWLTALVRKIATAATIALVVAGAGASTLWFLSVLRRLGLRVRFAAAAE